MKMNRLFTVARVRAFTIGDLGGSPTTVIPHANGLRDFGMQQVAMRMTTSHTAFIFPSQGNTEKIHVRFFTKTGEIRNCGHGTIAAQYFLMRKKGAFLPGNRVQVTGNSELLIEIREEENDISVYLTQDEIRFSKPDQNELYQILDALSMDISDLDPSIPPVLASPGTNRFLIAIRDKEKLQTLSPNLEKLNKCSTELSCLGCFIYTFLPGTSNSKVVARMFAPVIGVPEDVINGNSSGCLGACLLRESGLKQHYLEVFQGQHFNQDGMVKVKSWREGSHIRTRIGGTARIDTVEETEIDFTENNPPS